MAKKKYTDEELRERKNERQREYAKRTGHSSTKKYSKTKTQQYVFRFMLNTEQDIITHLEKQDNKTDYIRKLILKDIHDAEFDEAINELYDND